MNMNDDFEAILETCIEQIARGDASHEECLARYPQYATQLEPILMTASRLKQVRDVKPSPFMRARLRANLTRAMQENPRSRRRQPIFLWRMALQLTVLLLALVVTNTVFSQGALPGDSLYDWKLTSERIWRTFSPDPLDTDLRLSERRINEYVAVSNDETRRARVLLGYNELLHRFETTEDEEDRARILLVLKSQQDSLRKVGLSIPELDTYFLEEAPQDDSPVAPQTRPSP